MSKETKDSVYSPKGVMNELKAVEWPSFSTLMKNSGLVIGFTLLFGLYFFICEMAASGLINFIVGA